MSTRETDTTHSRPGSLTTAVDPLFAYGILLTELYVYFVNLPSDYGAFKTLITCNFLCSSMDRTDPRQLPLLKFLGRSVVEFKWRVFGLYVM